MNSKQLFNSIVNIDDSIIENSETKPANTKKLIKRYGFLAATLAIIIIAGITLSKVPPELAPDVTKTTAEQTQSGEEQKIINGEAYSADSQPCYSSPKPGEKLYFFEVIDAIEANRGTQNKLFLAIDFFNSETQLSNDSAEIATELERLKNAGYEVGEHSSWSYEGAEQSKVTKSFIYGLFTVDELESFNMNSNLGYGFRFELNGDGSAVEY